MLYFVVHYSLALLAISLAAYLIIFKPQKTYVLHSTQLTQNLQPGATVWTTDGTTGIVLAIYQNTLVIQDTNGEKREILKQTLKAIKP